MATDPERAKQIIDGAGNRRPAAEAKELTPEELRDATRSTLAAQTPERPADPLTGKRFPKEPA